MATGEEGTEPMATDTYLPTRVVRAEHDLHPGLAVKFSDFAFCCFKPNEMNEAAAERL